MSLVGNLEDLGLGDILQIVSLSRKSGVLNLSWGEIEGKILFRDGQVVAGVSSDRARSLGELLADKGAIASERAEHVDKVVSALPDASRVKEQLANDMGVSADLLDETVREEIESTVFSFFGWPEGSFNFELQEIDEELSSLPSPKHAFVMEPGLSPQYLAMEGTRLQDEKRREMAESPVGPPVKGSKATPPAPEEVEIPRPESALPEQENVSSNPSQPASANTPKTSEVEEDFSSVAEALAYYESHGQAGQEQVSPPPPENLARESREEPEESFESIDTGEEPAPPPETEQKAPPETAPSRETEKPPDLVIADDEPFLIESLRHHLAEKGYQVRGFDRVDSALKYIQQTVDMGIKPGALLADLIMPDQEGTSTLGGLELLEKARSISPSLPVYIMTDYENAPARERAQELGARYFFTKPKSSQLDEDYSSPELVNFVQVLESALGSEVAAKGKAQEAPESEGDLVNLGDELRREFGEEVHPVSDQGDVVPSRGIQMLKSMISELNDPSSSGQITLLVLRFAAELMNRAIIFLVAKNKLAGLGQFGLDIQGVDPQKHVRQIRIPLNEPSIFREAIQKRLPLKKPLKSNKWNDYLVETLGGERPSEVFVAPIIAGGKIAALIYGDNVPEDKEIGDTESLEIFLAQAGLAMEKALLEMRLRDSGEDAARNQES
ncbi:MAG: response regulator [bacterium]